MNQRGCFYDTKKLKGDGITTELKRGYTHKVLLLDTVSDSIKYAKVHAIDSLNSLGYCSFDDIAECLGKKNAQKVIGFCELKVRQLARKTK